MQLNKLTTLHGKERSKKRLGRGHGSGKGFHTVGRGQKGQKSRVGHNIPAGFEGGQVPLFKKLPKIGGFKNARAKDILAVSVSRLSKLDTAKAISAKTLLEAGIIKYMPKYGVKLIGSAAVEKKMTLKGFQYSANTKALLEKAGCVLE